MSAENLANLFSQSIFLSGLLAGFAITVVVQLIALEKSNAIISSSISVFIFSSATLVVTTVAFVYMLTALIGAPGARQPTTESLVELGVGLGFLLLLGLFAFLIGIGLIGWIHSKVVGIISSVIAGISLVGIIVIMRYVYFA